MIPSKNDFLNIYNINKHSKFIEYGYKLIKYNKPNLGLISIFLITTISMIFLYQLNLQHIGKYFIIGYIVFGLMILIRMVASFLNNLRINRICKQLNISIEEYNKCVFLFDIQQ